MFHLHRFNDEDFLLRMNGVSNSDRDLKDGAKEGGGDVVIRSHVSLSHMRSGVIPAERTGRTLGSKGDFHCGGDIPCVLAHWFIGGSSTQADLVR